MLWFILNIFLNYYFNHPFELLIVKKLQKFNMCNTGDNELHV